jgi:branched-chain amino acid transport system substrate-binding protein
MNNRALTVLFALILALSVASGIFYSSARRVQTELQFAQSAGTTVALDLTQTHLNQAAAMEQATQGYTRELTREAEQITRDQTATAAAIAFNATQDQSATEVMFGIYTIATSTIVQATLQSQADDAVTQVALQSTQSEQAIRTQAAQVSQLNAAATESASTQAAQVSQLNAAATESASTQAAQLSAANITASEAFSTQAAQLSQLNDAAIHAASTQVAQLSAANITASEAFSTQAAQLSQLNDAAIQAISTQAAQLAQVNAAGTLAANTQALQAATINAQATQIALPFVTPTPRTAQANAGEPLLIGVALPLSGELTLIGQEAQRAVEFALRERPTLNVDGQTVTLRLQVEDTGCAAAPAERAAQALVSLPNLVGVIGDVCNVGCQAMQPIFAAQAVSAISPACWQDSLTANGDEGFFRTIPPAHYQHERAADYLYQQLGGRRVAVMSQQPEAAAAFAARFSALGGEVVYSYVNDNFDPSTTNAFTEAATAGAEIIYVAGNRWDGQAALALAENWQSRQLENMLFVGDATFLQDDFIALVQGRNPTNPLDITVIDYPKPAFAPAAAFSATFAAANGGNLPNAYTISAYESATLLLNALADAATVNADGDVVIERGALQFAIRNQRYAGVTGDIGCDGVGNCAHYEVNVWRLVAGNLRLLATLTD